MQQLRRYLAFALFPCCSLFVPIVHGFSPIRVPRLSRRRVSTLRYSDDMMRTREVFRDDDDDDNESIEGNMDTEVDGHGEMNVVIHEPPMFSEPVQFQDTSEPMNGHDQYQDSASEIPKDMLLEDERTLYEILGASPDASREELKKRYVKLARETHPDATVGKSSEEREEKEVLFTEVAAAWRILSDKRERQRYDRSLVAKDFTRNVEQVAGEYADRVARTAAPAVSRVLDTLFRTASDSSTVSLDSAAEQVREAREARAREARVREARTAKANGKKVDVRTAIASAVKQGTKVARHIDRYELLKKSRELEHISMEEIERSMAIKGELANVMNKRLSLSLRTPNSALTSKEALKLLDGLNTVDSVTLLETIQLKHPVIHDINCLEEVENEYRDKKEEHEQAQQYLTETKEALWKADLVAQAAVETEKAARLALEEAQRQVISTRQDLMDWNRMYASAEGQHRKTSQEMEKVALGLERKQEKVRTALRRKEEEVLEVPVSNDANSLDKLGLADLERLRKEEGYLRAESNRLDNRAKRLRSRARKLKRRCEELKAEEERSLN